MSTKTELLHKILSLGYPDNEVALSLDEFFHNTPCDDSIGVNIYPDPPAPNEFYRVFKELQLSNNVSAIYVRITDTDEPENWFYSDTIYVIGTLSFDELKNAIHSLQPDEILEEWMYRIPVNIDEMNGDQKVYSIWWD